MDDARFLTACRLQDEGKFREAFDEFVKLADDTENPIDKGGVLLNAATTLSALGEYDRATEQLNAIRMLVPSFAPSPSEERDTRPLELEIDISIEEANIYRYQGKAEEALDRLSDLLDRHRNTLSQPDFRKAYEIIQTRRAFLLVDLGRWREAWPILEEAQSFEEPKEMIAFYLGHCYLAAQEYIKAEQKLTESLRLGLPDYLQYRAHCELGTALYMLKDYRQAKEEFEKSVETADPGYIKQSKIWKWLENTCRNLGLRDEAERFARLARPS